MNLPQITFHATGGVVRRATASDLPGLELLNVAPPSDPQPKGVTIEEIYDDASDDDSDAIDYVDDDGGESDAQARIARITDGSNPYKRFGFTVQPRRRAIVRATYIFMDNVQATQDFQVWDDLGERDALGAVLSNLPDIQLTELFKLLLTVASETLGLAWLSHLPNGVYYFNQARADQQRF